MKIKRFFAADIRQAMRMVKEELGADAVIMSNRSVDGGVEIVAARDFDEEVIHKNLKQKQEEELIAKRLKKYDLPEFSGDEKPAHLVSSARKKGNEVENPLRRNLDQYIGYAEKVQLGNANAQKISEKLKVAEKVAEKPAWAANTNIVRKPAVAETPKPVQIASSDKFMEEMRKEMKDMRALLDTKLSGISHLPLPGEQSLRQELQDRLLDCGFSKNLAGKITNRLGSHKQFDIALAKSQEMLARVVPIADDRLLEQGGIAALVGSTGVGKTTTIAKLAAQFMLKHGSRQIALITTDNYRIGAHEQINTYGKILDVPVRVAGDADELRQHIDSLSDKRLILIDTAGMSQRDLRLAEQIKTLQHGDLPIQSYLVMSATTQYKAALEIMDAFRILEPQATILTKFDEAVTKATALSALIERRMPLSFITDGQQVPEDIYLPDADVLIQQCLLQDDGEQYTDSMNYEQWMAESHA
ncbi:flagellar biosynthesis protein FlhF [Methylomonas methanica]|uniref:Flagellar biosynthesis protein FlhF n=1 Tax=Methylomonas methanica (strain DSM 25384 / MC09) TaxID=857087 RepID=G0A0B2_METMM|nr:flagellar biosynthesis protein FlhF [Methylomonas methanica]AEG02418.1 flagellar biosynthetic protein FlhF [Methylomonas methanica MC09]